MADQLAKIEQDRAVMLAGISHDLRTPLARLRLETEMSVADEDARDHMAADIDAARRHHRQVPRLRATGPRRASSRCCCDDVIEACIYAVQDHERHAHQRRHAARPAGDGRRGRTGTRVISNLLENARRYGKTPDTGVADVDIQAQAHNDSVLIKVRDHGAGRGAGACCRN